MNITHKEMRCEFGRLFRTQHIESGFYTHADTHLELLVEKGLTPKEFQNFIGLWFLEIHPFFRIFDKSSLDITIINGILHLIGNQEFHWIGRLGLLIARRAFLSGDNESKDLAIRCLERWEALEMLIDIQERDNDSSVDWIRGYIGNVITDLTNN